jgi:hypothetical protein
VKLETIALLAGGGFLAWKLLQRTTPGADPTGAPSSRDALSGVARGAADWSSTLATLGSGGGATSSPTSIIGTGNTGIVPPIIDARAPVAPVPAPVVHRTYVAPSATAKQSFSNWKKLDSYVAPVRPIANKPAPTGEDFAARAAKTAAALAKAAARGDTSALSKPTTLQPGSRKYA